MTVDPGIVQIQEDGIYPTEVGSLSLFVLAMVLENLALGAHCNPDLSPAVRWGFRPAGCDRIRREYRPLPVPDIYVPGGAPFYGDADTLVMISDLGTVGLARTAVAWARLSNAVKGDWESCGHGGVAR